MRLSRPFTIIALAMMKPPMNRNIIGLAKAAKASFIFTMPKTTQSVGPTRDVTGIGIGSVIHHIATSTMTASSLWASGDKPAIGVNHTNRAQTGPKMAPKMWRFLSKVEAAASSDPVSGSGRSCSFLVSSIVFIRLFR